jgi:membrane peptidoglycan carboxypeptidase
MLNVHGIAVSGPTFPAQIWHLFMESAVAGRPDVPFPAATTAPVWRYWRGTYEYGLAYGATAAATTASATTTKKKEPQPTVTATVPILPPPTVQTTTEAPPPETTTTTPTDTTQTTP